MSDCCGSITVPPKTYAEHELPLVENARKWYDTEYYVITHPYAYSLGPNPYNTPVYVVGLTDHSMYFDADTSEFVVEQLSLEGDWVEVDRILIGNTPHSFSFTFDQNGYIAIVWESEGIIYRYWYDTLISDHTITTVGAGKSPHINMESFNEILKPIRQIIMVYVNANNELVYRLQDDRYTVEYVLYEDVHSVVAFEHTSRNSLKLVYLVHLPPLKYELRSIATERLGEWIGDNASGEVEFVIDALVLRPVVLVLGAEERPIGLTREISDVELGVIPSVAKLSGIEERPIDFTRGISGVSLIMREIAYRTYFEEPIPEGLTHTSEFISYSIQDVRVDNSQEEPIPPALTHTCGFISYSLDYPKSSLLNLLNYANGRIEENYTPASWADMVIERDAAQIVYDDAGATQGEINIAWSNLANALSNLEFVDDGAGDPHWDKVVALLHFDGDFTDETGRIWTVVGSPTFVDVGEYQQAVLSQTNYIHSDVLLGDEPFTLEFFSAMTSNTSSGYNQPIIQWGTSANATDGFAIEYNAGQYTGINYRTSYSYFPRISPSSGWSLDNDKERNHIAIVYDGLSVVCYVNGVGVPVENPKNMGTTRRLSLGWGSGSWYQTRDKIIDELRITKGVARYTENFTPPIKPFPSI